MAEIEQFTIVIFRTMEKPVKIPGPSSSTVIAEISWNFKQLQIIGTNHAMYLLHGLLYDFSREHDNRLSSLAPGREREPFPTKSVN